MPALKKHKATNHPTPRNPNESSLRSLGVSPHITQTWQSGSCQKNVLSDFLAMICFVKFDGRDVAAKKKQNLPKDEALEKGVGPQSKGTTRPLRKPKQRVSQTRYDVNT